ncbi:MAG: anaerobic ribonucleoside-triphosphate reductase activating protein [Ruminococcaceae bacterium]|nr:anaerobic ribonucleoside-triphosphate reductase activating protein [Oscillospiraceae bacterium]
MNISGLQKMTLLDYPGKVACTVFLFGCNYRCPFCHNAELLEGKAEPLMTKEEFLSFLSKRKGLLDAVCISGGEPTLSAGLKELMADIKALGFSVKLDTNGSRPAILRELVEAGLVDYVAMDIKNGPSRYAETCGLPKVDLAAIEESAAFLMSGAVDSEFRTTVVDPLHDEGSILEMGRWLHKIAGDKPVKKIFLQPFVDRDTVVFSGLSAPNPTQMAAFVELLKPFALEINVRG